MNKICNRCGKQKEILEYYPNKTLKGGYTNQCRECISLAHKKFYIDNIKKYKRDRKRRYWADRDNSIKKAVEWAKNNKGKRSLIRKRWDDKNRLFKSVLNKNWNAQKVGASGRFTLEEYKEKLKEVQYKCGYCKVGDVYTVDHIIPISKGGSNFIENIMPACLRCNGQKGNLLIEEWINKENCFYKCK